MADRKILGEMIRAEPITHLILIAIPVVVALAQLANSLMTGLPFAISVPFAVLMVGFAGMLVQYNVARFRRRQLERELLEIATRSS